MLKNLLSILITFILTSSNTIWLSIYKIIDDPLKSFKASLVGTGTFTIPSYLCNIVGTNTPNSLLTLQKLGLIITISLGIVSLIRNIWFLCDKYVKARKEHNHSDDKSDKN